MCAPSRARNVFIIRLIITSALYNARRRDLYMHIRLIIQRLLVHIYCTHLGRASIYRSGFFLFCLSSAPGSRKIAILGLYEVMEIYKPLRAINEQYVCIGAWKTYYSHICSLLGLSYPCDACWNFKWSTNYKSLKKSEIHRTYMNSISIRLSLHQRSATFQIT